MSKSCDLQAQAEIEWWRDAHAMVEVGRVRQEQVLRDVFHELNAAWDEETFERAWSRFQKARKMLKKELDK